MMENLIIPKLYDFIVLALKLNVLMTTEQLICILYAFFRLYKLDLELEFNNLINPEICICC